MVSVSEHVPVLVLAVETGHVHDEELGNLQVSVESSEQHWRVVVVVAAVNRNVRQCNLLTRQLERRQLLVLLIQTKNKNEEEDEGGKK